MKFFKLRSFAAAVCMFMSTTSNVVAQNMIYTKKDLEWQKMCIQTHLYERPSRTTSLRRFGIKLDMPANYDIQLDERDADVVFITRIEDLAALRCNKLAKTLHDLELPGGGMSTIIISERKRLPDESNIFVDAANVLGSKTPVYSERGAYWISFYNPKSNRSIHISWDSNLDDFLRLLRSIQPD